MWSNSTILNTGALGTGVNASLKSGAYWDTSRSSLVFPGAPSNGFAQLSPFWMDDSGFSAAAWVMPTGYGSNMNIFSFGSGSVSGDPSLLAASPYVSLPFGANLTSLNPTVSLGPTAGAAPNSSSVACGQLGITAGVFVHIGLVVVAVNNGGFTFVTLYVNGDAVCAQQLSGDYYTGAWRTSAFLGRSQSVSDGYFAGLLADVQIYLGDQLADTDMTLLYNGGLAASPLAAAPLPPASLPNLLQQLSPPGLNIAAVSSWLSSTLSGPACYSSATGGCGASAAVNGYPFTYSGCGANYASSAGASDTMPHLTIDLGQSFYVPTIQLWSPSYGLQKARLGTFQILVGNAQPPAAGVPQSAALSMNPVCYSQAVPLAAMDSFMDFTCATNASNGRYVTVQLLSDGYNATSPLLQLCQIAAVSAASPPSPPNPPPSPPPPRPPPPSPPPPSHSPPP